MSNELVDALDLAECANELNSLACLILFVVEPLALKVEDEEAEVVAEAAEHETLCAVSLHQGAHESELGVELGVAVLEDVLNLGALDVGSGVQGVIGELGGVARAVRVLQLQGSVQSR